MEGVLLPHNPAIAVPKTRYVCHERYKGVPFLRYAELRGKPEAGRAWLDLSDYFRIEKTEPTPLSELEDFIQSWLFFGLLLEFLGVNETDNKEHENLGEHVAEKSALSRPSNAELIDHVYKSIVIEDSNNSYVTLDVETLQQLVQIARFRLPQQSEAKKKRNEHLIQCLVVAYPLLISLPRQFDHNIKYTIAALAELLMETVNFSVQLLGEQPTFGRYWATGYYSEEVNRSMREHGWCPSDIARAETKFTSIQTLNLLRMMDKSLPKREDPNHTKCTDRQCTLYQINMGPGEYVVGHQNPGCDCTLLEVQSKDLEIILNKRDSIPLLRFTGDIHNLKVQIVESSPSTPYVALSHVWADGLGNPKQNALYRCKLSHIRTLVSSLTLNQPSSSPSTTSNRMTEEKQANQEIQEPLLLWLDTLCCPSQDGPGKQKAIEKLRLVYQKATHVLVLDASLQSYASEPMSVSEQIARIFTSGWVRRLWTLQEGALTKSLYFQFADRALCLRELYEELEKMRFSMRHRLFFADVKREYARIREFFYPEEEGKRDSRSGKGNGNGVDGMEEGGESDRGPELWLLDQALQFRGVSVPTDEPLCIGTLMHLDISAILAVGDKEKRMRKVWELIARKKGGIISQIIFFEEERLRDVGWRWAPKSFLMMEGAGGGSGHGSGYGRVGGEGSDVFLRPETRMKRWVDKTLGTITEQGLKVHFPGFRIHVSSNGDQGLGLGNPWEGFEPLPEVDLKFRDESGCWFRIIDTKSAVEQRSWTSAEQRRAYNAKKLFPLNDLVETGKAVVIMRTELEPVEDRGQPVAEGVLGIIRDNTEFGRELNVEIKETGDNFLDPNSALVEDKSKDFNGSLVAKEEHEAIDVETKHQLIVSPLHPDEGYIYTTASKLATQLRNSSIANDHITLFRTSSPTSISSSSSPASSQEQKKESTERLKQAMKELTTRTLEEDQIFRSAVIKYFWEDILEDFWVLVADFFRRDFDFWGERLGAGTVWVVD